MNPNPDPINATEPKLRRLLPQKLSHPLVLLLIIALPQTILLCLNLRTYTLVRGEMDQAQHLEAHLLFAGELVLLIGGSLFALWKWRQGRHLTWAWHWLIFVPHVAFLAWVSFNIFDMIPVSLRTWIAQPETITMNHFIFLMPATFYAALSLACFPARKGAGRDFGLSLLVALGIPAFWYVVLTVGFGDAFSNVPESIAVFMVIASSLICLAAVMRIVTVVANRTAKAGRTGQFALVILAALGAPLCGLLLNRQIPFPADFQAWYVYALTILNGLLLLLPKTGNPLWDRIIWLAQCALLPFSLYFFLVFLPYLPLAALAMIAVGAGFLILSPTVLFILHVHRLARGVKAGQPLWLGVLLVFALPMYGFVELRVDRLALNQAIDYVYSPNLENEDHFAGSRLVVKRSLSRLRDVKEGIYLPFLTEFYNAVVLKNLVLSDDKMQAIHRAFFGEVLPSREDDSAFGWRPNRGGQGRIRLGTRPLQNAILEQFSTVSYPEGDCTRTILKLEMHNPSGVQSEYAVDIQIPEGVFVSGYWLNVGEERVPGRIFERKTAMWVYRMIRDAERRDPGLLLYTGPRSLELRVFPFAAGEERITEIEFLSPPGMQAQIQLGEETFEIESTASGTGATLAKLSENSQLLTLDHAILADLPSLEREPYLHFIVDQSRGSMDADYAIGTMKDVAAKFPEIQDFVVTLANYEFQDLVEEPIHMRELDSLADREWMEPRGGFLHRRAIQRTLARHQSELDAGPSLDAAKRFPQIVVLWGDDSEIVGGDVLHEYASALPDVDGYYVWNAGNGLWAQSFDGDPIRGENPLPAKPVHLLKSGKGMVVSAAEQPSTSLILKRGDNIQLLAGNGENWFPLENVTKLPEDSLYARAGHVWEGNALLRWNPDRSPEILPRLVQRSRDHGILVPATSYIVVENSAQWEMLKRKEDQKLKGNHGLDFMESPEPGIWIVALLFFAGLLVRRFRSRAPGDMAVLNGN